MKSNREIRLGVDVSTEHPDTWRLVAECDDELTQMIMVGGARIGIGRPDATALSGELGRVLVAEHLDRCGACRAWQGDRTVVATPGRR